MLNNKQVWDTRTRKLKEDLPGHADEVYAVDWSTDGQKVASGGKDCVLKLLVCFYINLLCYLFCLLRLLKFFINWISLLFHVFMVNISILLQ